MSRILNFFRFRSWSAWLVNPRQVLRSLVSLDDTAQNIALGVAIGVFIGLTPTPGVQMLLVLMVAPFIRFNRMAALLMVYISNPLTAIPLNYMNYKVGTLIFGETVSYEQFVAAFGPDWQQGLTDLVCEVGLPLLVGSCIVAVIGGLLAYPCALWTLRLLGKRNLPSGMATTVSTAKS